MKANKDLRFTFLTPSMRRKRGVGVGAGGTRNYRRSVIEIGW